jgi:hypothetical protein
MTLLFETFGQTVLELLVPDVLGTGEHATMLVFVPICSARFVAFLELSLTALALLLVLLLEDLSSVSKLRTSSSLILSLLFFF